MLRFIFLLCIQTIRLHTYKTVTFGLVLFSSVYLQARACARVVSLLFCSTWLTEQARILRNVTKNKSLSICQGFVQVMSRLRMFCGECDAILCGF